MKAKFIILTSALLQVLVLPVISKVSTTNCLAEDFYYAKINDQYNVNDSLTIPGAFIDISNQSYQANHILTYPSGLRTYESKVILNESGKYVLEYYFLKNNKYYSKKETFNVVSPFYQIGANSSVYYGAVENSGTPGLVCELASKEEIVFNQTIDIFSYKDTERALEAYIAPFTRGTADFNSLIFTFYNPLNVDEYLKFRLTASVSEETYPALADVSTQGNGTDFIGFERSNGRDIYHHNDGSGSKTRVSFRGRTVANTTSDGTTITEVPCLTAPYDISKLKIDFDYASKKVYTYNPWFSFDGTISSPTGNGKILSCDLDDFSFCGSRIWNGFSSRYVKLKINADGYNSTKARFVLTNVNGLELDEDKISDLIEPTININSDYIVMPVGKVGCKYPIPTATAIDNIDGYVNVKTTIWKNFGTENASNVENNNGYFNPTTEGEYVIEYSAVDSFGNIKNEYLNIFIGGDENPIVININEQDKVTSAFVGSTLVLPSPTYSGGSGELTCKTTASIDDYVEEIGEEMKFTPERIGKWKITYTVTDFIGSTQTYSFNINVGKSDKAVLAEPFYGDEYIVSYTDYKIPNPKIIDYINNVKTEVDYVVDVTFGGNTTRLAKGDTYYFGNVENNSEAKFEYYYNNELITSFTAKVINPFTLNEYQAKLLQIDRYLASDDSTIIFETPTLDTPDYKIGAKLVSNGNSVSSFKYINYLLSPTFEFDFASFANDSKFDSVELILRDSIDKNNKVTIKIEKTEEGYFGSTSNGESTFIKSISDDHDEFLIRYENETIKIGEIIIPITVNDSNITFNGFKSNKVSVEFKANNLELNSYLYINKIGNQSLKKVTNDNQSPDLYVFDSISGCYDYGTTISTPIAIAQDALANDCKVTISIIDEDTFECIENVDGELMDNLPADKSYDILLNQFKTYVITYSAAEIKSNKYWPKSNEFSDDYKVTCVDLENPTIKFTSYLPETCSVGDKVALPSFNVDDNAGKENVIVSRFMVIPNGYITAISDNYKSYKFTEKGTYEYRVVAKDISNNYSIASLYITVK